MIKQGVLTYLCAIWLAGLASFAQAGERVTIFAAASLKSVLDEIATTLPGDVVIAYGGSAAMARQVVQGAGADLLILAHPEWMDWAAEQGALADGARCDLIGNHLVIAGPASAAPFTPQTAQDLIARLGGGRLATGHLTSVPAGQYTKEWLDTSGWTDTLRPHLAETSNVRLALALVARGETPLGIVYTSDVAAEPKVRTLYSIPPEAHTPIVYPLALTATASEAAQKVKTALVSAIDPFTEAGFTSLPESHVGACR